MLGGEGSHVRDDSGFVAGVPLQGTGVRARIFVRWVFTLRRFAPHMFFQIPAHRRMIFPRQIVLPETTDVDDFLK